MPRKPSLLDRPQFRRLHAPKARGFRKSDVPAIVLLGWTPSGKPVASIPVLTKEAAERRIRLWEARGYKVSSIVEFDVY